MPEDHMSEFGGVNKGLEPHVLPVTHLADGDNMVVRDGRLEGRPGIWFSQFLMDPRQYWPLVLYHFSWRGRPFGGSPPDAGAVPGGNGFVTGDLVSNGDPQNYGAFSVFWLSFAAQRFAITLWTEGGMSQLAADYELQFEETFYLQIVCEKRVPDYGDWTQQWQVDTEFTDPIDGNEYNTYMRTYLRTPLLGLGTDGIELADGNPVDLSTGWTDGVWGADVKWVEHDPNFGEDRDELEFVFTRWYRPVASHRQPCEVVEQAPCSCPCTSWPAGGYPWDPADEPCGGLLDEYLVSNNYVSPYDGAIILRRWENRGVTCDGTMTSWHETRLRTGYESFKAVASGPFGTTSCVWRSTDFPWEIRTSASPTWTVNTSDSKGYLFLYGCKWLIYGMGGGTDAVPALVIGQTPAGDFTVNYCVPPLYLGGAAVTEPT